VVVTAAAMEAVAVVITRVEARAVAVDKAAAPALADPGYTGVPWHGLSAVGLLLPRRHAVSLQSSALSSAMARRHCCDIRV